MVAPPKNSLIVRLKEELKKRNVKVPAFEDQTGIPRDRVYKWLKRDTGKIGNQDATIIENWIIGKMDNVPHETPPKNQLGEEEVRYSLKQLSEATNRHSIIDELNAKNIDRLLTILEKAYGIKHDDDEMPAGTPEPDDPHSVNIEEKNKVKK